MGEVVSGVASALLGKLATKAYQEITSACGLRGDVEKLQETMDFIGAYLVDAENKQVKQESITKWLQQLKEAFYRANDILDEIECETLRNQVIKEYGSAARKVGQFFSYSNPLAFRLKMSRKIRNIRERINEIASTRERFGLDVINYRHDNHWSLIEKLPWRETHSNLPSRLTGRDQEKEEVINDLMRSNLEGNKIDVIPIVGIGGMGKTILAQMVYNDGRVIKNFQLRMWVCVSDEFDVKRLMLEIPKAASKAGRDGQNSSLDQVKTLLQEEFHRRKFLLVLDDVWNENSKKWQELEDVLLSLVDDESENNSKIIVTTRSKRVASIMGNVPHHDLEELPKKECLELFFKCVFPKGKHEKHPRLKDIGEEIVEKCQGVPLAVVTLGCLLKSQYDESEWKKIRDSELWELEQYGEDSILPALKLSYNQLLPPMKQCFSLCSIFPKDYEYSSLELISFWMAHGLLQSNNDKEEPEYVGELYIKKLVEISFFLSPSTYRFGEVFGICGIVEFKIHDLVHDLAMSMMRSEHATVINGSILLDKKVRHLSISNDVSSFFDHKLIKVRTIISQKRRGVGGVEFVNWICSQFRHLRVLDFQDSDFVFLPNCLHKMKHLRYLNLQSCWIMGKLPNSICKLQNLEYLNLFDCNFLEELPRNMSRYLVSLRSFLISGEVTNLSSIDIGSFKCLQFLVITSCENLVSLPRDLRNLISLKKMIVESCPKLVVFEDDEDEKEVKKTCVINNFSLQVFGIFDLPKLTALPNWLTRYATKSLHSLFISSCESLLSLPVDINQIGSLRHLYIIDCNSELEAKYREGPERTKLSHVHIQFAYDLEEDEEKDDEEDVEEDEGDDEDDDSKEGIEVEDTGIS